jgi:cation-transporting ATPase I
MTIRAATAAAAHGAWFGARATSTPTRARTVTLAALVGTQLGQTLVTSRRSPLVAGTCACRVFHPTSSCHESVFVNETAELVAPS